MSGAHGGAAIGEHGSLAPALDERHDDAGALRLDRPDELDAEPDEPLGDEPARRVVAALAQPAGLGAQRRRPGCDVRSLPAR